MAGRPRGRGGGGSRAVKRADELIFVVPRDRLLVEPVHGFERAALEGYLMRIRAHGVFKPRATVEQDVTFKQVIPYLIVRHRDRLFLFRRSGAGGEARLHGMFSIGVGGHINRADVVGAHDPVAVGLRRELEEELVIPGTWSARLVGVLNDDTDPAGLVHFGLVHVVDVDSPEVAIRESEVLTGGLTSWPEVLAVRDRMETWSQLILDAADPLIL